MIYQPSVFYSLITMIWHFFHRMFHTVYSVSLSLWCPLYQKLNMERPKPKLFNFLLIVQHVYMYRHQFPEAVYYY